MENPQKLTCILCNKQIPAEAHIHHCENGNPVEVVKIFLGDKAPEHLNIKNPKNAFAVRADVSITVKCSFCNKNDMLFLTDPRCVGWAGGYLYMR